MLSNNLQDFQDFLDNKKIFATHPKIKRLGLITRETLYCTNVLGGECLGLIKTLDKPPYKMVIPLKGISALHVLSQTFQVAAECVYLKETVNKFKEGIVDIEHVRADVVSMVANVMAMAYITGYTMRGLTSLFSNEENVHEINVKSAQRVENISAHLTKILSYDEMIAALCGITPE